MVLLTAHTQPIWSQQKKEILKDIEGTYNMLENPPPEGGVHLIMRADQTFYVVYFGGINFGTWKIQDSIISFSPRKEPKFIVYSRENTNIENKKHLRFGFDDKKEVYAQLADDQPFRPIFNKKANCFQPEYSIEVPKPFTTLRLAKKESNRYSLSDTDATYQVFTYTIPEKHNDILIITLSRQYTAVTDFKAIFKDHTLFFGPDDKGSPRRPLKTRNKEDTEFLKQYGGKSLLPDVLEYRNEFFPALKDKENISPNELIPFTKINITKTETTSIKSDNNPLFVANCD